MAIEVKAAIAFALAVALTFALTPLAARIALRVGAVAEVGERSLHQDAMPSLGGLAILVGALVPALIFVPLHDETSAILVGAVVAVLVGTVDDIADLHPGAKLIGQAAAAAIPVMAGVVVDRVTIPFIGGFDLGVLAEPLTLIGIVGLMNVVNFTDGVDGLAAGVCAISAATLAVVALSLDRGDAGILAACTAGAALGFLFHNFDPASISMGDAGSNLLGYLLACIAIQGVLKTAAVVALVFPLVILAVPILDTGFVVAKRIKYGVPVYQADRWHFHHRFVNIRLLAAAHGALSVRVDGRPGVAGAGAALRAVLRRPRQLRHPLDRRDDRDRAARDRRELLPRAGARYLDIAPFFGSDDAQRAHTERRGRAEPERSRRRGGALAGDR